MDIGRTNKITPHTNSNKYNNNNNQKMTENLQLEFPLVEKFCTSPLADFIIKSGEKCSLSGEIYVCVLCM